MSHGNPISRHQHKLNQFLNGLAFIVGNFNVSGNINATTKFMFKTKLPQSEFDDLAKNSTPSPKTVTNNTITFQIEKMKVKITN